MRPLSIFFLAASLFTAQAQTASRFTISTIAGTGVTGFAGDGGAGTAAQLAVPYGLAVNAAGAIYVTDQANQRLRLLNGGAISTVAGNGSKAYAGDGAQAINASLSTPAGVAVDGSGNVYIADSAAAVIRKMTSAGVISTIAGNNTKGAGFAGDGGAATSGQLNTPLGLAVDAAGAVYVADLNNHRVRKIGTDGNISTVAGNGGAGYFGDGGAATAASLNRPVGVAVDAAGNLYIADSANHRIRKVSTNGTISTVAGTGNPGYSGDLGPATQADLKGPTGVTLDAGGNLYIADSENHRIRRVSAAGTITTVAGNGKFGYSGDGDLATNARLYFPIAVAADRSGNVFVTDTQSNVVRQLTPIADFTLPPAVTGAVGAGGFGGFSTVAPGAWIEIYGTDLATTARSWGGADFVNGVPPTMLDGTSVTVGGLAAPLSYISGGQLNVMVPLTVGTGTQTIRVTTLVGTSAAYAIEVAADRAGLYAPASLNLGGRQYVGATLADGNYAAPAGANSRPARAGESITMYGTGFGPTAADGRLTGSLQVSMGGVAATVTYAGLAPGSVGLYQINVTVPGGVANDAAPLTFVLNGAAGQQTLYLAIGN